MSKVLLLALTLVLSAAWLQAQDQYPQSSSPTQGTTTGQAGSANSAGKSVEGCLQGSDGNYTLTDSAGTTYQLRGDTAKLSEHVGHEVRITGSSEGMGSESSAAGGSSGSQPTLMVEKVKHVSKTCKGMSKDQMGK